MDPIVDLDSDLSADSDSVADANNHLTDLVGILDGAQDANPEFTGTSLAAQYGLTMLLVIVITQAARRYSKFLNFDKGTIPVLAGVISTLLVVVGSAVGSAVYGMDYSCLQVLQFGTSAAMASVLSYYGVDRSWKVFRLAVAFRAAKRASADSQ
jgi:hypothetical protein